MYQKITNDKEWVKKIKREHTVHDNKSYLICFPYAHFFFQHISDVPDTMNWVSVPNPDLTLTEKKASIEKFYWKLNNPPPQKKSILVGVGARETVRVSERALAAVRCVVWSRGDTSSLLSCCSLVSVSQLSAAELLKHSIHITAWFFDTSANKYTVTLREVVLVVCSSSLVAPLYRSTTTVFFWVTCKFSCETEDE